MNIITSVIISLGIMFFLGVIFFVFIVLKSFRPETEKERLKRVSRENEVLSENKRLAEQEDIAKIDEAKRIEKLIKEEKKRNVIEKFKVKEIGAWIGLPWILSLIISIYILYDYFKNDNFNWYLLILFVLAFVLLITARGIEDGWKGNLSIKEKIREEDENFKWVDYSIEYIYTDSFHEYIIYYVAKVVCYLVSFVIIGLIGILLFLWLGSISIAPTTVIIILLIIVIYNQLKKDI